MLGIYNQNFNNMYSNQNYGYQQPQMFCGYQQQASFFGGNNYGYQQQSAFLGGNNYGCQQSNPLMSMIALLFQAVLGQGFNNQQNSAFPGFNNQQNNVNSNIGGININNYGNIGNINIADLFGNVNIDQTTTTVEEKPHKVAIVTSYKNQYFGDYKYTVAGNEGESSDGVEVNLGRTIQDFAGQASGNGAHWDYRAHDFNKDNDQELQTLLSKMSDADKNLKFDKGQAYIIDETTGKILGTIANNQVNQTDGTGSYQKANYADASLNNSSFKILNNLGVDQGVHSADKNNSEAQGGKITFNGKTYDVGTTVVRKETPLTFDLNGDGVKTSDKVVEYDINGDGKKEKINDVADGTLSIRGGKDGKDLFGNNTDLDGDGKADGFKNGFDALKALAKKEGLINCKDDMVLDSDDIRILEQKFDFGMKTGGYNSKAKSLAELGITEINLGSSDKVTEKQNFDGKNNDVLEQEGATFNINGQKRDYADVLHSIKA